MSRSAFLLAVAILAAVPVSAQSPPDDDTLPKGIRWQGDWDAAVAQATEQKKPIMVAFLLAGEPANDEIMRSHFTDSRIIDESRKYVCLAACLGLEGKMEDVRFDGTRGPVSAKLGSASPGEIANVEKRARAELMSSPTVSAPQFVFLKPDGRSVLLRHVWMLPAQTLLKKMKLALAYHDPESAPPEFRQNHDHITALLAEADGNNAPKRKDALKTLATVDDPRVTDFLIKQTSAKADGQKKIEAIFYMGAKGNAKVLPRLHELLDDGDLRVRVMTAVALHAISMVDSAEPLVKALKKESKERVRSHLLRAIVACADDPKLVKQVLLKAVNGRNQLERVTALFLITDLAKDKDVVKALLKAVKASDSKVRTAAYYAIGSLIVEEAKKTVKARLGSEKGSVKSAAEWAYERLGGDPYEGEEDVGELVYDELPDPKLYDGDLEEGGEGNKGRGRGGRGGRGGGRGGGGRR